MDRDFRFDYWDFLGDLFNDDYEFVNRHKHLDELERTEIESLIIEDEINEAMEELE